MGGNKMAFSGALAALLLLAGCGGGTGSSALPQQLAPPEFRAVLSSAADQADALDVEARAEDGRILVRISTPAALHTDSLAIRLEYDPLRYSPAAAAGTAALAPPARSLTLERLDMPGRVEYAQAVTAGQGSAPAGAVLLEVLFNAAPAGPARLARSVPRASSAVAPLEWDAAAGELRWRYVNPGDYNQNGSVEISDLFPLGQHFRAAGPFPFAAALSVIDGVPDGEINLADLQPLAVNFGNAVERYNVYASDLVGDIPFDFAQTSTLAPVGGREFASATGSPASERLAFSYALPPGPQARFYWVRPAAGGAEGTRSTVATLDAAGPAPGGFNLAPRAALALDLQGSAIPLGVLFDATASSDPDGSIASYEWDFEGDGLYDAWGSSPSIRHDYLQPGTYAPAVRVMDNDGAVDVFSAPPFTATLAEVTNIAPLADIAATAYAGGAPLTVGLLASGSRDVDGQIVKYEWDFQGDGGYDLDSGADPTVLYTYMGSGDNLPTVRITDDGGLTATAAIALHVAPAPVPQLKATPSIGQVPLAVEFAASSSVAVEDIAAYDWDLDGDGSYEASTDVPHIGREYSVPGTFEARVRLTDKFGVKVQAATQVIAQPHPLPAPHADLQPAAQQAGHVPFVLDFDAGASTPGSGDAPLFYEWDFNGDGTYDSYGSSPQARHSFTAIESCNVTVRVTDGSGQQATDACGVTCLPPLNLSNTNGGGFHSSLAVVDGNPALVYESLNNVYYMRALDAAGTAWGQPRLAASIVSPNFSEEVPNDFAVIAGRPAIVYVDRRLDTVRYVSALDAQGDAWGTPASLPGSSKVYDPPQLVDAAGRPAVVFKTTTNSLNYVRAAAADGSAWPAAWPLVPAGSAQVNSFSLVTTPAGPAVAYQVHTSDLTRQWFAAAAAADGSAWNAPALVQEFQDAFGGINGMALAMVSGRPAIAYGRYPSGLYFIHAADAGGASWGAPRELGQDKMRGYNFASMQVADNYVYIVYRQDADWNKNDLRYVKGYIANLDYWSAPAVIANGPAYAFDSLLLPDGRVGAFSRLSGTGLFATGF